VLSTEIEMFALCSDSDVCHTIAKLIQAEVQMQNRSHAVMAQRTEAKDSRDDFPTPPWATRALIEHVLLPRAPDLRQQSCLEPACGVGHMDKVLREYFATTSASDCFDYGYGKIADFQTAPYGVASFDWVITNPPFNLAEDFINRARKIARRGVAILARTVFIESVGRFERLFSPNPPAAFAQFVERVPMVKGRLDKKASTATGYAWFVWLNDEVSSTELVWIPPCRKVLEKEGDYEKPASRETTAVVQRELFDAYADTGCLKAAG
jgi:hypothetical protein